MPKQLKFDEEARSAPAQGRSTVNGGRPVKATLGPKGPQQHRHRQRSFGSPDDHQGRASPVAKGDRAQGQVRGNMGAQDGPGGVASKTSRTSAGDGTNHPRPCLAQAIFRRGALKNVTARPANPNGTQAGPSSAAGDAVVKDLKSISKSTKDKKEITQVATIASNKRPRRSAA